MSAVTDRLSEQDLRELARLQRVIHARHEKRAARTGAPPGTGRSEAGPAIGRVSDGSAASVAEAAGGGQP
jgi:hypothetical protein